MSNNTTLEQWLTHQIEQQLHPEYLDIEDESYLHAGHAGNNGGQHFRVAIVSKHFVGKSKIARHQIIYQLVGSKIPSEIHALSLSLWTPEEYEKKANK